MSITILGIESSCDDTSASVIRDGFLISNVMAGQSVHGRYGGVIPELASRAHQQNIVPVVSLALKDAKIGMEQIDAIAFTRGPGLLGSLLVGTSFAKGLSLASGIPIIDVNHLHGHLLAPFIKKEGSCNVTPNFPYLSLLVSGGHTQIVKVNNYHDYSIIGQTIDDAVGEAFDKCAKIMDLGYPGGPIVDKLSKFGESGKFRFSKPKITGFDYSFSGVKTSLLYFLRDKMSENPGFIEQNLNDICASYQKTLIDILLDKLILAAKHYNVRDIALGGGVSANSSLRERVECEGRDRGWRVFLPELSFTTDNAAMIAIVGYYKYLQNSFAQLNSVPVSRNADF